MDLFKYKFVPLVFLVGSRRDRRYPVTVYRPLRSDHVTSPNATCNSYGDLGQCRARLKASHQVSPRPLNAKSDDQQRKERTIASSL